LGADSRCILIAHQDEGVGPGEMVDLQVHTSWLPRLASGWFWGLTPPVRLLSEEREELADEVHEIIDSVSGVTGGWVSTSVVAPVRDPSSLSASTQLAELTQQLEAVCTALRWITSDDTCFSLRTKLDSARQALEAGQTGAAKSAVKLFMSELGQARRSINDSAYLVLWINAEDALERLAGDARSKIEPE
jgi:hypothetical protein